MLSFRKSMGILSNKNIVAITVSILIIVSYYLFISYESKVNWIQKYDYSIKLNNVGKNNAPAVFRNDGIGKFYIHPGAKQPTIGTFTVLDSMRLKFMFSLQKGAKAGNIKFTINKNGEFYETVIVKSGKDVNQSIEVFISQNDTIDVLADNHGSLAYDWGSLSIQKITFVDSVKNNILPLLWVMLFLFLFQRGFGYSVIISYALFLFSMYAEILNFGAYTFSILVSYMVVYFLLTFVFVLLYQWFNRCRITFLFATGMTSIVLLIPVAFVGYIHIFETVVNEDILFAIFQTHQGESFEFISTFIELKYLVYLFLVIIIMGVLHYLQNKKEIVKIDNLLGVFIILSLFTLSIVQIEEMRIPKMITESYEKYIEEIHFFTEEKKRRKTSNISFKASKENKKETYVVVIGESLNKNHMGLYGYVRNTTPNLSKMNVNNNLMIFNNIYSNHTVTTHTLSFALTEANQYNKLKYYNSISIIELLNKANFETHWVTAQKTHGAFQNLISVIASEADHFITSDVHDAQKGLDGSLIKKVKKILNESSEKNRVIFVHLQGSHYSYTSRYPTDTYCVYKDTLNPGIFGKKACTNKTINEYDNSVVYNDYVVSSILKELQEKEGIRGFIYMPDHAEDVIGGKAHNPTLYTDAMTQIPMISWFSKAYMNRYIDTYNVFKSNVNTLFSNDMFYDTLIGVMNVKTEKYNARFDLSSSAYKLEHKDALVLHGAKRYTHKDNYIYWQQYNTQYLIDNNISSKIIPNEVNSIGMLNDVLKSGYSSCTIDISYDNKNKKFIMGTVSKIGGVSFEDYIKNMYTDKTNLLWINIDNISTENYRSIIEVLKTLDSKFNIKNNYTFILKNQSNLIKAFRKEGWNISYNIDSASIFKYMTENNIEVAEKIAMRLVAKVRDLQVSKISFSRKIYPFIKEYIEDKLPQNISYHIYDTNLILKYNHFIEKLNQSNLLVDERVKAISIEYKSEFRL